MVYKNVKFQKFVILMIGQSLTKKVLNENRKLLNNNVISLY